MIVVKSSMTEDRGARSSFRLTTAFSAQGHWWWGVLALAVFATSASAGGGGSLAQRCLVMETLYRVEIQRPAATDREAQRQSPVELICIRRAGLPEGTSASVSRLLCEQDKKPRMAYFARLDPEAKFPLEKVLVDVGDGAWIRLRGALPKSADIRDKESTKAWAARLSSGEFGRPRMGIDTDMLRFDPIGQDEELEPFAAKVHRDIDDPQPELAAFLEWAAAWLGAGNESAFPGASAVVYNLSQFAGFGPGGSRVKVKVTTLDSQIARGKIRKSLDPDLEERFGKWACWPDPPRLDE